MIIKRYQVYLDHLNEYESQVEVDEAEGGEFVYWDDHIKIVDQQLAEISSLKASLAKLMSSLEQWDEVFK